jgi:hypothetical protein
MHSGTHEKDVDLLPLLTKGLYSELIRVKHEPILRMCVVFRKLDSSEAADDLMALICEEACSQKTYGPGDKIYIVDEISRGMYFLTKGDFELREYREDDVKAFKLSPQKSLTTSGVTLPMEGWTPTDPLPSYNLGWLAEFSLFEPIMHDTTLFARAYCEVLQVSRTSFLAVVRKFPILEEVLSETNKKRYEHAVRLTNNKEDVGDWVRLRAKSEKKAAVEPPVANDANRYAARPMASIVPLVAAGA